MPVTDYNKLKKLSVNDVNDSGTTQDKAQPILLLGNDFTGVDGFESGSSQLGWENDTGFTIDTTSQVYGDNSLQLNSPNTLVADRKTLQNAVDSASERVEYSLKIDNQTGNSSEGVYLSVENSGTTLAQIRFTGDGSVEYAESTGFTGPNYSSTGFSWSADTIYDIEIVMDFDNNQFDLVINTSTVQSGIGFFDSNTASQANELVLSNNSTASNATVNTFFDRLTYTASAEDSVNTGGDIRVDFTNIADAEDIAVYDQDGNLLDYEIEELDTTNETGVIWCYNSWTRDDSVQAQIAYGDNSANEDRSQDGTGGNAWNNTGQGAFTVQHLQDDPLTATDSTANNVDGTVNGATAVAQGQFDGAASFDGNDDDINFGQQDTVENTDVFVTAWVKTSVNNDNVRIITDQGNDNFNGWQLGIDDGVVGTDGAGRFVVGGTNNASRGTASSSIEDGEWHLIAGRVDKSAPEVKTYQDGVLESTDTTDPGDYSSNGDLSFGARFDGNNFYEGDMDEGRVYTDIANKDEAWVQAEYDASPKGGQVYFTQDAAETTVTTITDTATKYSSTYSSLTSEELVTITETAAKYSSTYTSLTSDEVSSATDTATKYAATYSSITSVETADFLDQATKYTASYTTQTSTEVEVRLDEASKYQSTYTSLTTNEFVPITDTVTKYTSTYNSQTSTEVTIHLDTATKYQSTYNSLTSDETSSATDTATKYSSTYSSIQSEEVVKQIDDVSKYTASYTSKTTTETILVAGPDVTYPLFVNEDSMEKFIKDLQ